MMKKILTYLTILCFLGSCSQDVHYQKMILTHVINEPSTNDLFDGMETIPLLANKYSIWELGTEIDLGEKKIKIVNPTNSKQLKVLKFTSYEVTDSTISIEMNLLHKNVIYKANFKKEGKSLKKLSSNIMFVRRPLE
ncbi:MAG TPA: hypothetical protein VF181_04505 [Balneolaceae bacterium]